MASSDSDSSLVPDPRTSALGDLSDTLRSRLHSGVTRLGDFGREVTTDDRLTFGGGSRTTRRGERAEQIDPPRDAYEKFRNQYDTTPLISAPIDQMASDVTADGWRITADDERTAEFLTKWGEQCAIIAGETGKDFVELVDLWSKVYDIYGTPVAENVPAMQRPDAVAALKMVPPATITYHTRPGSSMLLRPGDTEYASDTTDDGKAAAYTQYDENADETWTDGEGRRLEQRALSVDQLTRAVRNPDPGNVTGKSAVEQISEQVETLKHHFRNDEVAVESAAWKQLFVGYEPLVVDTPNGKEIIELDEDAKGSFEAEAEESEPGTITYHDGQIRLHDVSGETADIVGRYEFLTEYILSAMPAPKFMAGFADNLNRDIAEDQAAAHEQAVKQRKQLVGRTFTPVFKRVADQHAYPPDGVEVTLEPQPDASPIKSLSNDEMQRFVWYTQGLDHLTGTASPQTLVNEDVLLDEIAQLDPDEAALDIDTGVTNLDETDPEVVAQMQALNDGPAQD